MMSCKNPQDLHERCDFCGQNAVDPDTGDCIICHRSQEDGCDKCGSSMIDSKGVCLSCGHNHMPQGQSPIALVDRPSITGSDSLLRQDPDYYEAWLPGDID